MNEKLRIGLGMQPKTKSKPYKVKPFESDYAANMEQQSMNQLADELETDEFFKSSGAKKHERRL